MTSSVLEEEALLGFCSFSNWTPLGFQVGFLSFCFFNSNEKSSGVYAGSVHVHWVSRGFTRLDNLS